MSGSERGVWSRRRFLGSLAASAVAAPLLAARGNSAIPSTSSSGGKTGPGSYKLDLGGYKGPKPTGSTIQLKFMRQSYPDAVETFFKNAYAQWNEAYPKISVHEQIVPYPDLPNQIETYVASGTAPDIMMGKGDFILWYDFYDVASNLSQYLTDEFLGDITPALRQSQTAKGHLIGMPWVASSAMLMYFRKDHFQAAGIATPPETTDLSSGWTWDQAAEAWASLQKYYKQSGQSSMYAVGSESYGTGGPGGSWYWDSAFVRSMGNSKAKKQSSAYKTFAGVSPDGLSADGYINTSEAVAGITNYQRIFSQGWSPKSAEPNQWVAGTCGTFLTGIGQALLARNGVNPITYPWSVSPLPHGAMYFNQGTSDCPIVWSKSKYPAEAAALLGYLTNDANAVKFTEAFGESPARTSLFKKIGIYNTYPFSLGVANLNAAFSQPKTPGYLEYYNAINSTVKNIALGGDPKSGLNQAASQIDQALQKYHR